LSSNLTSFAEQKRYSTLKIADTEIADADELKTRLIDEWAQFDQSIVDAAISQCRRRLSACVRVRGAHFGHKV